MASFRRSFGIALVVSLISSFPVVGCEGSLMVDDEGDAGRVPRRVEDGGPPRADRDGGAPPVGTDGGASRPGDAGAPRSEDAGMRGRQRDAGSMPPIEVDAGMPPRPDAGMASMFDAGAPGPGTIDCTTRRCYHVRADAPRGGSGMDWSTAFTALPATLERGAVYFVADGTYGSYTFDDAAAGGALITVRRATAGEHGAAAGWLPEYGDGAATFGALLIECNDLVIDGATGGGPGSWTSGFGFIVENTGPTPIVSIGLRAYRADSSSPASYRNIALRHFETRGNDGRDQGGGGVANDALAFYGGENIVVSYASLQRSGRCHIFSSSSNTRYEYVYGGHFTSTSETHAEIASLWSFASSSVHDVTFANCMWAHLEGTGGLIFEGDGMTVYGNVFFHDPAFTDFEPWGNGAIG